MIKLSFILQRFLKEWMYWEIDLVRKEMENVAVNQAGAYLIRVQHFVTLNLAI